MAEEVQSNIRINIDSAAALANLKNLQRQISAFHTSMAKGGASAAAQSAQLQQSLVNSINATGKFSASMKTVKTSTESFTEALEKNKMSMGQYFRYAGASTKTFGKLFSSEFNTIEKVARERVKTLQTQYIKMGRDANGAMKAISVRPLALDMDNLATKTAIAAQKQQILNQLLKQGSTNLLNFGKNTQWAGRQLMVGFTIPLSILGTTAAKTFMQLEEQAIRFKRVYGEIFTSTEETDAMAKQIQLLAKEFTKYGVSVEKTMKLAADAAASGKMGADLLAQVSEATRLAVLGGVEQEQALETTISLTNAFGTAAEELAGKIDFLNAVENQTVTSIEDLTIAIPKAGPVIEQLGGNVEDLAFFLTAMKEGGINASEGANALKSGLASMINPTGKAAEFLQSFGINLKGIVEANKGDVKGTVIEFARALDTLDPLNRARAIEQLFGKFQFARLSTLFKNVVQEGTQASRVLSLANATTEELAILSEREMKRIEDSPMYKFKKAIEDIKVSLAPVGEAFLKAVTPVIEFGTKILEKFNSLDEGARSFIIGLTAVVGGLGPVLIMTFGLLANGVANIIKGFAAVRSIFQKTGQQSNVLGSQTDYMTQQQLEAAAVAASLEQVHSRLIQTFTSEATAVGQLALAYEQALIAQSRFGNSGAISRTRPGGAAKGYNKGTPMVGYASGVSMVPGRGNKDTVPAMLTPGEAVIPKDMAKKYAPLIQGMIAGNIPGYNEGLLGAAMSKSGSADTESFRKWFSRELEMISKAEKSVQESVTRELTAFVSEAKTVTERSIKDFLNKGNSTGQNLRPQYYAKSAANSGPQFAHVRDSQSVGAQEFLDSNPNLQEGHRQRLTALAKSIPGMTVQAGSGLGFAQSQKLNKGMSEGGTVSKADFLEDFDKRGIQKWSQSVTYAELQMSEVADELKVYDTELSRRVKALNTDTINQQQFTQIEADVRKDLASKFPTVAKAFDELASGTYDLRYTISKAEAKAAGFTLSEDGKFATTQNGDQVKIGRYRDNERSGRKGRRISDFGQDPSDVKEAGKAGQKSAQAFVDGQRKVAGKEENDLAMLSRSPKRNSPHPQVAIDGADDAKSYNAARAGIAGKPPQSGAQPKTKAQLAQESKTRLYGSGPVDSQQKSLRRQSEKVLQEEARLGKQKERLIKQSKKNLYATEGQVTQAMRWERKAREAKARLLAQQQRQAAQEIAITAQEDAVVKKQGFLNKIHAAALAAKDRLLNKEKGQRAVEATGGRVGMGGKIGMAASSLAMVGSMMPGKVGETSQKLMGFTFALSAASSVIDMVPPKFKVLAIGIAAVSAAIFYAISSFNKAQDEAMSMAEAMGSGTKNIQELSKAAGKVSAGEAMDRRRKDAFRVLPIQTGKKTFGESFMEMDAGKNMLDNVKKSISSGGTKKAMSEMAEQLQTAVLSGAMSTEQAKSVAANVAEALGDRSFGLDIIAKITELVGPNGEKLEKDPLGVSMKLVQQNVDQTSASATGLAKSGAVSLKDVGSVAAGIASGALVGMGIGRVVGATVGGVAGATGGAIGGSIVPVAGTAAGGAGGAAAGAATGATAGTVIGGIAGAITGGVTAYADRGKRIGTATGAAVAMDKMALEQNQQILDAFDLQYEKKINALRLQGKINEAVALENTYYKERETLVAGIAQTKQQILDSISGLEGDVQAAYLSGLDKATKKKYKGTLFEDLVPEAQQQVKDSGLDKNQQAVINIEMMTGGMDPLQVIKFFEMFDEPGSLKKGMELVTRFGGKFASSSMQILNSFVTKDGKPIKSLQTKYIQQITGKTDREAAEFQDFFNRIASYQNIVDVDVVASYMLKNPKAQQALENSIEQINKKNGKLSLTADAKIIGAEALAVLNQDVAYFDSLSEQEQKTFVAAIQTQMSIQGTPEAIDAYNTWKAQGNKGTYVDMAVSEGKRLIADQKDTSVAPESEDTSGSTSGGGPTASSLDDLVKKIRDVRKASTELTVGWKESMGAINKLFGGNKSLTLFNGLENQLRSLGAGEDLITLIAGMPPEEFEKQKNKLFTIKNGNITGLKDAAKSIGDALRSVAIGDFVNKQQQVAANFKAQTTAVNKLTAAGLSAGQAYEVVQDATVAAAIANKQLTDKELKTIVATATAAAKAMRLLAANTDLAKAAAERQDQGKLIASLAKNTAGLDSDQISTIMGSKSLQEKILLEPNMSPATLKKLIAETASDADLEITLKSFTVEGLNEIFNGIYDKAMNWFSQQENAIELKFQADTKADQDIITAAENKIARIDYLMDDYEAGLQDIEEQEQKINDSYDTTIQALDKIKDANQDILSLQKSQLGVAEALTQGDIAGAARAAQEYSQQEATIALEQQRKSIEEQRQADLGAVSTVATIDGVKQTLTREQIEKQIAKYKKDIFALEEASIEPARERVRQATLLKDQAIAALELDGKSKTEWANIASQVGLAEVNSTKYLASVTNVEGIVEKIKGKWAELNGKTFSTVYEIIEKTIKKVSGDKPPVTPPPPGETVKPTDKVKTPGSAGKPGTGGNGSSPSDSGAPGIGTSSITLPGAGAWSTAAPTPKAEPNWWDTTIGNVSTWLSEQWTKVSTWFSELGGKIATAAGDIWTGIQSIPGWLEEQWTKFTTWLGELPYNIGYAAGYLWGEIQNVGDWLGEQWDKFYTWFTVTLPEAIAEWGASFWSGLQTVGAWLTEQWNKLSTWFTITLPEAIKKWAKSFWEGLQSLPGWLAAQWEKFKTWFTEDLPNGIKKWASNLWSGIQDLGKWLGTKAEELKNWIFSLPAKIATWASGIWDGFWAGLASGWDDFVRGFTQGNKDARDGKDEKNNGGVIRRSIGGGVPGIGNGDVVSAMLTPGEYVIRKEAVNKYGLDMMSKINAGQFKLPTLRDPQFAVDDMSVSTKSGVAQTSNSVYNNYNLNVNVKSDANADDIARTVMTQIRQVNSQQIRGVRL
jgi:TP901 family phage tail tape measure protein